MPSHLEAKEYQLATGRHSPAQIRSRKIRCRGYVELWPFHLRSIREKLLSQNYLSLGTCYQRKCDFWGTDRWREMFCLRLWSDDLFVPQALNRIEAGGANRRQHAANNPDESKNRRRHQQAGRMNVK